MDSFEHCIQSINSFVFVKTTNSLTNLYTSFTIDQFLALSKDEACDLFNLSYHQSINKSCYKEIENFHNKIFLFKEAFSSHDSWQLSNITKIIDGKALIKTITISDLLEHSSLLLSNTLKNKILNNTEIKEDISNNKQWELIDINQLKQLKHFESSLIQISKDQDILRLDEIKLSKLKSLLINFFSKAYSLPENSPISENIINFKIIVSNDHSTVKYLFGNKDMLRSINNVVKLFLYDEALNKALFNEYDEKNKNCLILSKLSTYANVIISDITFSNIANTYTSIKDKFNLYCTKYNHDADIYSFTNKSNINKIAICSNSISKSKLESLFHIRQINVKFQIFKKERVKAKLIKFLSDQKYNVFGDIIENPEEFEGNQVTLSFLLCGRKEDVLKIIDLCGILLEYIN